IKPQINLTTLGGYKLPPVVCIPSTNVAESADVIKKILINNMATSDITVPSGNCSNTENRTASSPSALIVSVRLIPSKNSKWIADPPITVHHNAPRIVGTNNTPKTTSLMVLPRDTRAINVPTNGAQAIHHAQSNIVQSLIQPEF